MALKVKTKPLYLAETCSFATRRNDTFICRNPCFGAVWVALRAEKLRVATQATGGSENCVAGRVAEIAYLGNVSVYKVRLDNGLIMKAQLPNLTRVVERPIGTNDRVWLSWTRDAGVVLTA